MISFRCPGCGAEIEVPDDYAGRSAGCPSCGRRIRVPTKKGRKERRPEGEQEEELSSSTNVIRVDGHSYEVRPRLEGMVVGAAAVSAVALVVFLVTGLTLPAYSPWIWAGLAGTAVVLFATLLLVPAWYNIRRSRGRKTGRHLVVIDLAINGLLVLAFVTASLVALVSADRSTCPERLRSIHAALVRYADKNAGAFPAGPETLVRKGYLNSSNLTCPASNPSARSGELTWLVPGYWKDVDLRKDVIAFPGDLIIVFDRTPHTIKESSGRTVTGFYVLELDGKVQHVPADAEGRFPEPVLRRQQEMVGRVLFERTPEHELDGAARAASTNESATR